MVRLHTNTFVVDLYIAWLAAYQTVMTCTVLSHTAFLTDCKKTQMKAKINSMINCRAVNTNKPLVAILFSMVNIQYLQNTAHVA